MLKYEDVKQVHLELSSHCNSSCPTCPRNVDGGIVSPELKPTSLSLEDVMKILPVDLLKQLNVMNMCGNYGDPIMCKDIIGVIRYIQKNNYLLELNIHTNGGIRDEEFWTRLGSLMATMPNSSVTFSIDGLADTNHLYRIGVDWNRLMRNVTAFINAGGNAIWDFLVFSHNEHQINDARRLAEDMGFYMLIEGTPHSFNYNGKMRVVDRNGKFIRHIEPAKKLARPLHDNSFNSIDFDISLNSISEHYSSTRIAVLDKKHGSYINQIKKFNDMDDVEVQECTAVRFNEIYIDSDGGVHPCCYLGHINKDTLPIPELVYHKKWIDETVGLENINALNKSIKEIMQSYFSTIKQGWTKTFAQGRNPMCVLKCGVQRPNGFIRTTEQIS
jgi:MoaA/NifB/PqqE/SkfB family radical SAM enzyme